MTEEQKNLTLEQLSQIKDNAEKAIDSVMKDFMDKTGCTDIQIFAHCEREKTIKRDNVQYQDKAETNIHFQLDV